MCGVAGYVRLDGARADRSVAERMAEAVAHRGPDDAGVWAHGAFALGHRRLAIIDTSPGGHQPMCTPDARYALSFNGEIYNYRELRAELESAGVGFRTASDTEVLLQALVAWGEDALIRLNGMFAFAFVDVEQRRILLARDRFGVKPLYVGRRGHELLFGSEVKAILAHPSTRAELDPEALAEYLTFQNLFSRRTLFRGIELLPAGCMIVGEVGGGIVERRYWDYDFLEPERPSDDDEYLEELQRLFEQAVRRQMVSDVPVSAYLSGGMDSGAITAVAARHEAGMRSFTVGFDLRSASGIEMAFDERPRAEHMSYLFGTEHYEMVLKAGDMERCMDQLAWHIEEPRVGQSYPNFYAAGLASRFSKVVLAGTGGDELFAGYPWRYYQSIHGASFDDYVDKAYAYWQRLVPDDERAALLAPVNELVGSLSTRDLLREVFVGRQRGPLERPEDYLNHSLYLEAKTFLNGLLLVDDKLSMAHGLETRVPFLDNDLVDFAQRIPARLKLHGLGAPAAAFDENVPGPKRALYDRINEDGKVLLRRMMASYVPSEIAQGRKQGFSAPDASWFRGESIDYVRRLLLADDAAIYDYLDRGTVRRLVAEHLEGRENRRLLLWSLLSLEHFARRFLAGGGPTGR